MKIIGIDYGTKHIGTAVGDTKTGVAVKLRDLEVSSQDDAKKKLVALLGSEEAECVVFGLPQTFLFEETEMSAQIREFGVAVADAAGIRLGFMNEVLSSDLSKRMTGKEVKDHSSSAVIILQDYLNKAVEHGQG